MPDPEPVVAAIPAAVVCASTASHRPPARRRTGRGRHHAPASEEHGLPPADRRTAIPGVIGLVDNVGVFFAIVVAVAAASAAVGVSSPVEVRRPAFIFQEDRRLP